MSAAFNQTADLKAGESGICGCCGTDSVTLNREGGFCEACYDRAMRIADGSEGWRAASRAMRSGSGIDLKEAFSIAEAERFAWLSPNLRDTDAAKLPGSSEATARALAWEPTASKPFLVLHGETGSGKTRLMALLMIRRFEKTSRKPLVFWAGDLGAAVASAWKDSEADAFTDRAKSASLLAFDDIDKVKFTERVAEFIFSVTDHRMRHGLPMILTTNLTGENFRAILPPEYGPALLRRWREGGTSILP